jgi:hypothetical protein
MWAYMELLEEQWNMENKINPREILYFLIEVNNYIGFLWSQKTQTNPHFQVWVKTEDFVIF